jgi:uncharacterized OB-fold protein
MASAIEDLVAEIPGSNQLTLVGSRCRNCKEVLFPAVRDCPVCMLPGVMEDYRLRGHGTIRDYVIAERGPEGFDVPYVQAWLTLDDGPSIFSIIETAEPQAFDLEIGAPVTMVLRRFGTRESGFTGWKAVPDSADERR